MSYQAPPSASGQPQRRDQGPVYAQPPVSQRSGQPADRRQEGCCPTCGQSPYPVAQGGFSVLDPNCLPGLKDYQPSKPTKGWEPLQHPTGFPPSGEDYRTENKGYGGYGNPQQGYGGQGSVPQRPQKYN